MHQGPQFHEIILQRRSGQEQSPPGIEVQQDLPLLRLEILDIVGLVQNQIAPVFAPEDLHCM